MTPNGHGMISCNGAASTDRTPRLCCSSSLSSSSFVLDSVSTSVVARRNQERRGTTDYRNYTDRKTSVKSAKSVSSVVKSVQVAYGSVALIVCAIAFCGLSGCSRTPTANPNAPAPAPKWNWEAFPLSHRMRLGVLSCRILPKSSQTINSPFNALLHLSVDRQQTNLPAGFVWGEFEPKTLRAQSNALAEARTRLQERERYMKEVDFPAKKLEVAKKIEEARIQVAYLEVLSTNQGIAPVALPLMPLKDRTVTPETLQRSREELQTLLK